MKEVMKSIGLFLLGLLGGTGLLAGALAGILLLFFTLIFFGLSVGDELLLTSVSPTGAYELEVHRINPGATEPYSIRVLCTDDGRDRQIYQMRGQEEADVQWLTDEIVSINGIALNIAEGETYKGNLADVESMEVCIAISTEDVYALEMEFGIARAAIGGRGVSNARATLPLFPGKTYCFKFSLGEDFPHQGSLKQGPFWMVLSIQLADGETRLLPIRYEWDAHWQRTYAFTLTGSREGGFTLTPEFTGCTLLPMEEGQ